MFLTAGTAFQKLGDLTLQLNSAAESQEKCAHRVLNRLLIKAHYILSIDLVFQHEMDGKGHRPSEAESGSICIRIGTDWTVSRDAARERT